MTALAEEQILAEACFGAGLDPTGAEPIRIGENAIFRLRGSVVARISRPGRSEVAAREVEAARWLASHRFPATRVLDGVKQPVEVDGRAVTFWDELPPHRHGTAAEVGEILRRLHELPIPAEPSFAVLDPFTRLPERIEGAATLSQPDRLWLGEHLAELKDRYTRLPDGLPHRVLHGDAWVGNIVTINDGPTVLLDLERFSTGPPEWDLISTAIKHTSFGWVSAAEYQDFCRCYGHDVTGWAGFEVLRDIRELRMACYLAQHAAKQPGSAPEAQLRVACLRGSHGVRPWDWTAAA